jgi:hypothetical protein
MEVYFGKKHAYYTDSLINMLSIQNHFYVIQSN